MRTLAFCTLALLACSSSSNNIGPDKGGGDDGALSDGGARPSEDGGGGPAKPGDTTSGSRLKARYLTGDDGSKSFTGWLDTANNEPCAFVLTSDGTQRCLPNTSLATVGIFFADSACTVPAAFSGGPGCTAKFAIRGEASPSCGATIEHLYAITGTVGTPYQGTPASCVVSSIAATYSVFTFAATESAPSEFVKATESHE